MDKKTHSHPLIISVPVQIYNDPKLSGNAKWIATEIFNLLRLERLFCWASNKHFAKMFNLSESNVSYHINTIKRLGYIATDVFPNGCNKADCPIKTKENHRHIYPTTTLLNILDTLPSKDKVPSQAMKNIDIHKVDKQYKKLDKKYSIGSFKDKETKTKSDLKDKYPHLKESSSEGRAQTRKKLEAKGLLKSTSK